MSDERQVEALFESFLVLARTGDAPTLAPLAAQMRELSKADGSARATFMYHITAGVTGVRSRLAEGPVHLETALDLFDRQGLGGDPLCVEAAILSTLTLIRPHETRAKFASLVDRLEVDTAHRARLLAMIGLGDAWAGNLVRGQAEMLEACQLAVAAGRQDIQAEVTSWLIKCEALRGDVAASAEHLRQARELAAATASAWVAGHITEGAASLHFTNGDTEAWLGLLRLMVDSQLGADSGLLFEYRWELATHHAFAGEHATAKALLHEVPDPPMPWPGSPAMPAWRAWILDFDSAEAADAFQRSLSLLSKPAERLPRARMMWLLGRYHARAGRRGEAVGLLEGACSGYATIGAAGMLALVVRELRELIGNGTRARAQTPRGLWESRPGEQPLTGAEVQVAVAVADGLSNRETASRLFISVKTVEFHLGNIFRKLGVRNRTELARWRGRLG